ncbi:UDP-2,3-diacylglucosamine diphosphatase [Candidatus Nitrosacidococcus tergens]|uniref:UDP-2,3-diacylglucosamine hydrolase n=1 Tax=Candidatus Nitrosacidococcus tergens TaxID=553981 RepID=A0A7G1Q8F7_9GAMM|nr:UDP-2,3-diacylglucosamine diphosphatase [Candidatus Nitrosacidococcus tergens]CAB1275177.1 UDP-2,3-diacylglucosamine pyrophosphatase [Candidatus Nitrosacidococcus tergens]
MTTFFISDLHLSSTNPNAQEQVLEFLAKDTFSGEALYILGDLFNSWIGDDAPTDEGLAIASALHRLSKNKVQIYFLPGNRDFLVGQEFAKMSGCQILPDPIVIDLYGTPTLLTHGDILCTDDKVYQRSKARFRRPIIINTFLSLPKSQRQAIAQRIQQKSREYTQSQPLEIMDANQNKVEEVIQNYQVTQIIHGHTHHQGIHEFSINNNPKRRIVLGDWFNRKSILAYSRDNFSLMN